MKKLAALMLMVVLLTGLMSTVSHAEEPEILGDWYFYEYQDLDDYPGTVFKADTGTEFAGTDPIRFTVYSDGENLIAVDRSGGIPGRAQDCTWENGVLTIGCSRYSLEDGRLVRRLEYDGAVHCILTYARSPQEAPQIAGSVTRAYKSILTPADYDGTWELVKYGMNGAFADASDMDLQGSAVIENGKMTIVWTRAGVEKSYEIEFDSDLNEGRLYMIKNGTTSYIVSLLSDHTIILHVGLSQSQWVFRRKDAVSEETVRVTDGAFEETYASEEDWFATEGSRNRLAAMLLETAAASGLDPASVDADSPVWLCSLDGQPVLICQGTGAYKHYILSVGHGTDYRDQTPFFYFSWDECMSFEAYDPDRSLADVYVESVLSPLTGGSVWMVEIPSAMR